MDRRTFLKRAGWLAAAMRLARYAPPALADALASTPTAVPPLPTRPLGRTGHQVGLFSLGGEGVLRTVGRAPEATAVIERALALGVNYCDTAPAYAGSQDYYGRVLPKWRDRIFLASKTHDRTRKGSLLLLDDSLRRLGTDHLDLWQLHDLRTREDLDVIFSADGAMHAMEEAKRAGRVRFLGITGHHDPAILVEAINRYPFDTLLVALNAADRARLSFIDEVLPVAVERRMGIIGMKVLGHGRLIQPHGPLTTQQAIHYALSLPISTVIIGCSSPSEVEENLRIARAFTPLSADALGRIEMLALPVASDTTDYKRS